ncbi:family 16 glycosylhydrolase [Methylobacterium oxalidis]|uniref:family 16 glycosylhydrolase n=1 Tax=Methylobacterium oxalidis TaxID=944322 RepID=UPI0033160AC7
MSDLNLAGYKLTFDDEFNTRSISQTGVGTTWADIRSQWRFDENSDIGFGHSSFVDAASGYDPFKVEGGALSITAVPDRTKYGYVGNWESGLITTQGNFSQTYGYFEMRADLSDAKGGWDAFWLLPNKAAANPNNLSGWQELDVVEHYGAYNQGTYRWIHTTDTEPNKDPNADLQVFSNNPAQASGYHTYGMDWQRDEISFYFDGQFMGSKPTPSDMHGPMYLLANLATQSDADQAGVPMTMKIDYIRAYSKDPAAVAVTQAAVSAPDGRDPGLHGATSGGSPTASLPVGPVPSPSSPVQTSPVSTPPTTQIGSGPDKLILMISQDAYQGDAQFTVSVDGKQIGGTMTAHASHAAGQSDMIAVNGDWASGNHNVSINFLNDVYEGTASTDRNLYVNSATYNGADVSGSHVSLMSAGTQAFIVHDYDLLL